jgi:hypothetical protein
VRYEIAHSVRGRLRLRYPARWLKTRRDAIESRLRGVQGVHAVRGSSLTGSVWIDYDPFSLAEAALIDELHAVTASLERTPVHRRRAHARPRVKVQRAPLLKLIGAVAAGSWGGQRPSLADYVTVIEARDRATAARRP